MPSIGCAENAAFFSYSPYGRYVKYPYGAPCSGVATATPSSFLDIPERPQRLERRILLVERPRLSRGFSGFA
jgi:hypothetical protein